jgi:hypothetical protein
MIGPVVFDVSQGLVASATRRDARPPEQGGLAGRGGGGGLLAIPKSTLVGELRKYAAKQTARIGAG